MIPEEPRKPLVVVVGARHGSLGDFIANNVHRLGVEVVRAGIATEPVHLDAQDQERAEEVFHDLHPTHVVCTVGVNDGLPVYADQWWCHADEVMATNFLAPMKLLAAFEQSTHGMPGTFVAISSNSAHVARSSSAAYCASKAALSMAIRCAARDFTRARKPISVWGYEPGALTDTPMTVDVQKRLARGVTMSRMLTDPAGMPVGAVARIVARDLLDSPLVLHGCMVRLDNGEQ